MDKMQKSQKNLLTDALNHVKVVSKTKQNTIPFSPAHATVQPGPYHEIKFWKHPELIHCDRK